MGPKDILDKLKWHPEFELNDAEITIINRGAPRDRTTFSGDDIQELGSGFMTVRGDDMDVKIPYHRITKITTPEETLWEMKP